MLQLSGCQSQSQSQCQSTMICKIKAGVVVAKMEGEQSTKGLQHSNTLSQVRISVEVEIFPVFFKQKNNQLFQLNPSELLALTWGGEDDRKIIEEVRSSK